MKKLIIGLVLILVISAPAFAADDTSNGRFGIDAGYMFFTNDNIDNNTWFAGLEYTGENWSAELDYTNPDGVPVGEETTASSESLLLASLDYLYYFNSGDSESEEMPTYIGGGYTHRFGGDLVDDQGGFNAVFGMDWDQNWNFEARYVYFGSSDSLWGVNVGYFFDTSGTSSDY